MFTRTYRALVAGIVIAAVFGVASAGLNVYVPDATVVNEVPLVLVCTESVWVRVAHAAAGGSLSVTLPMLVAAPRSTWSHCGNAPLTLSQ